MSQGARDGGETMVRMYGMSQGARAAVHASKQPVNTQHPNAW